MIDYSKLYFREGTWDRDIFRAVAELNEYQLPQFEDSDIIIDIGTHVGGFTWACALRGARTISSFEVCKENYELACKNKEVLDQIIGKNSISIFNKGVYRSDVDLENTGLKFSGIHGVNTGGGNILTNTTGELVDLLSLDSIIDRFNIRLLKLDCEGSEFPILLTSKKLNQVQEIVGEWHEIKQVSSHLNMPYETFTFSLLKEYLEKQGFEFTYIQVNPGDPNLGNFKCINKNFK